MEIARTKEPGTLQYEIYFNDDESECIVLERYQDSDALIEHGANVADLMEPILATASVSGELLGEPSAALRAQMVDAPGAALDAVPVAVATARRLRRGCAEPSPRSDS